MLACTQSSGLSYAIASPWADLAGRGDSIKAKADVDPVITADAVRVRARPLLPVPGHAVGITARI